MREKKVLVCLVLLLLAFDALSGCVNEKQQENRAPGGFNSGVPDGNKFGQGHPDGNKQMDRNGFGEPSEEMMLSMAARQLGLSDGASKKEIIEALGLPAGATDEEIRIAIMEKNPVKPELNGGN